MRYGDGDQQKLGITPGTAGRGFESQLQASGNIETLISRSRTSPRGSTATMASGRTAKGLFELCWVKPPARGNPLPQGDEGRAVLTQKGELRQDPPVRRSSRSQQEHSQSSSVCGVKPHRIRVDVGAEASLASGPTRGSIQYDALSSVLNTRHYRHARRLAYRTEVMLLP